MVPTLLFLLNGLSVTKSFIAPTKTNNHVFLHERTNSKPQPHHLILDTDNIMDIITNAVPLSISDLSKLESTKNIQELIDFMSQPSGVIANTVLSNIIPSIQETISTTPPTTYATMASVVTVLSLLRAWIDAPIDFAKETPPFQPGTDTYNPKLSDEYYQQRPLMVIKRIIKLALLTGTFNTGLIFDWLVLGKLLKDEEYTALKNAEPRRAKESLILCEQLGPTFIKLGQALSIREDIVPPAYALELRQLQDAVSPFDSTRAYEILRKELGSQDLKDVFASLSEKPIASASIGQVYRGILRSNGKDVAVKVQRPGILSEIALDLYILRLLSPIQTKLQNAINGIKTTQEDIDLAISLVDEWGRGFVAETDYNLEATNTINFGEAMKKRGLDAVCAPTVLTEYVRDKVLITEWVDGTRLDADKSEDVPRLCGVAINAYLTMLLDTGVLHCDPHPGNLLRTTDGKLCILDWGMTLNVPTDLQYALLEFIAHINVEDFDAIPQDFKNLGFTPEGVTTERLQNSGITEGIAFSFKQLSKGGGPKKIQQRVKEEFQSRYGDDLSDEELRLAAREDMMQQMEKQLEKEGVDVKGVTNVMEEMSRRNRELFQLPPYVLYVARAFSTLEGIGLSIDDNYAILQECYPYLARRLFTDRNPRAKNALRSMLGLSNEELETIGSAEGISTVVDGAIVMPKGNLKTSKLLEMSEGFTSYTSATTNVEAQKGQENAVMEFTKLFLDPKGSTIQDILVDETSKIGDAAVRSLIRAALIDNAVAKSISGVLSTPKNVAEQNEALWSILPSNVKEIIGRPANIPQYINDLVNLTPEDERVLSNVRELSSTLGPRIFTSNNNDNGGGTPSINPELLSYISKEETRNTLTQELLPGVAALSRRIGAGLLKRAAYRTERSMFLSEDAKKFIVDGNIALANVIEPKVDDENDS